MLVAGAAYSASPTELDKQMSYDGLERVKVKGISLAYRRAGATLAPYKRVKLDPVEVRFNRNWNPTRTGSRIPLSAQARESIRTDMAKLVYDQFVKTLAAKGGYPVTNEAGADVLRLRIYIVDLYINAPDNSSAGASYTFVTSAGEMTLYMELFDSESGQILARVADRQQARNANLMAMANSVTNIAEAEEITAAWARILRTALDRAQAAMKN